MPSATPSSADAERPKRGGPPPTSVGPGEEAYLGTLGFLEESPENKRRARNIGIAYLVAAVVCLVVFARGDGGVAFDRLDLARKNQRGQRSRQQGEHDDGAGASIHYVCRLHGTA